MSQISVFQCDGPTCVESTEEAFDDDDLIAAGWFTVTFQGADDEGEQVAHLHCYECLADWARVCADEED